MDKFDRKKIPPFFSQFFYWGLLFYIVEEFIKNIKIGNFNNLHLWIGLICFLTADVFCNKVLENVYSWANLLLDIFIGILLLYALLSLTNAYQVIFIIFFLIGAIYLLWDLSIWNSGHNKNRLKLMMGLDFALAIIGLFSFLLNVSLSIFSGLLMIYSITFAATTYVFFSE